MSQIEIVAHIKKIALHQYIGLVVQQRRNLKNDDATHNRSNLTVEDAMDLGFWDMVPTRRGDSMG